MTALRSQIDADVIEIEIEPAEYTLFTGPAVTLRNKAGFPINRLGHPHLHTI